MIRKGDRSRLGIARETIHALKMDLRNKVNTVSCFSEGLQ